MSKNLYANTTSSVVTAYSTLAVAAHTALVDGGIYRFVCTSNAWIRQGTSKLVTCVAKASLVDNTDYITITANGTTVKYAFDVDGAGVPAGYVQVNVSADTTAANVAARLKTAINANQTSLTVTDPANGTLIVDLPSSTSLTITENVANAGFTVGTGIMQATAGAGSMLIPASFPVDLDGHLGPQLGVIRATADGSSVTTRMKAE